MKVKSTKRMLLTSILALAMCFSMLVGTTFAWFTDSVTTGSNVIKSGNLDIEVEYTLDGENWNDLNGATDLFQKGLWEPGHTEVVVLRVKNVGTLALKYTAQMNILDETIGKTKDGADIKLSDILTVSTLTQAANDVGEIALMLAYLGEKAVAYENERPFDYVNNLGQAGILNKADRELFAGDAHYLFVKVDMAETVGNEANHNGVDIPTIEFGINVLATQFTQEEDSFGTDYDALATYMNKNADGAWEIESLGQLIYFAQSVNKGTSYEGETVVLTKDIDLANIEWTPIGDADVDTFVGFKGTFDGQNHTISNLKINSASWGKGFFGYMDAKTNATVKNVNFNTANVVASDCAGVVVGYATNGTFENIHVTNASVTGTTRDGHIGGIAGCGYNASFTNCSVENGSITSGGSFAGGIVGYQCNNTKTIKNCSVEGLTITGYAAVGGIAGIIQTGANFNFTNNTVTNVELNMTHADAKPSIGALIGCYSGTAATTLTGAVSNVILNGTHVAYSAYNTLYGSNYSGATTPNFDVTGVTVDNITNNLVER